MMNVSGSDESMHRNPIGLMEKNHKRSIGFIKDKLVAKPGSSHVQ